MRGQSTLSMYLVASLNLEHDEACHSTQLRFSSKRADLLLIRIANGFVHGRERCYCTHCHHRGRFRSGRGAAITTRAGRACGLRRGPGALVAGVDEVDDRRTQYPGWV